MLFWALVVSCKKKHPSDAIPPQTHENLIILSRSSILSSETFSSPCPTLQPISPTGLFLTIFILYTFTLYLQGILLWDKEGYNKVLLRRWWLLWEAWNYFGRQNMIKKDSSIDIGGQPFYETFAGKWFHWTLRWVRCSQVPRPSWGTWLSTVWPLRE